MLSAVLAEDDKLYWEIDVTKPPPPKRKLPQAEEESLDNSILMVKMAMSIKKGPKSVLKGSTMTQDQAKARTCFASNSQTVTFQVTSYCNSQKCYLQCNKKTR